MIAQAVNLMNFLKGPKQFYIPVCQSSPCKGNYKIHTDAIKDKLIPLRNTREMLDSDAIMDVPILPDCCICALYCAQTFEKNVDNGGVVRIMRRGIELADQCRIQGARLDPTLQRTYQLDRKDYTA